MKTHIKSMLNPDKVYTIKDLETWPTDFQSLAVVGYPVAHSKSPLMHNSALQFLSTIDERFSKCLCGNEKDSREQQTKTSFDFKRI